MSDNKQLDYSEEQWDRAFALLKGECDEMSATVREGSKLLAEAREGLSKKLKEMSCTGEFAQGEAVLTKAVNHDGGTGAVANRKPPINTAAGLAQSSSSPAQILEAERKRHCTAHRLTQEAAERWPEGRLMANMNHCRFENTLQDLRDCEAYMDSDELSEREGKARNRLLLLCSRIAGDYQYEIEELLEAQTKTLPTTESK